MFNVIIFATLSSIDAERALRRAEHVLRYNWNLYGFHRLGSGYELIETDGFGNPFPGIRTMRLFAIAIAVPEAMDYRVALAYLDCGLRAVNCEADIRLAEITQPEDEDEDWDVEISDEDLVEWQNACVGIG